MSGLEVREAGPADRPALFAVRFAVFVDEQGVPAEEEIDHLDDVARHVVALRASEVVGTCRVFPHDGDLWTLGRMAVTRAARGLGVGMRMMREAERLAAAAGAVEMHLSAQTHAIGFYRRAGYRTRGGVYLDCDIPHVHMQRSL